MDVVKSRLKTASNGSLHSAYNSYGSHNTPSSNVSRGQLPRRRRPLRNTSHNSILPPSPGPLTSMLKTTTETGDISIFSIQPSVTPTAYHQLPRARPDVLDGITPPRYTPKKGDNFYYTDDHRHFRSYRDTTSEIISLYGYDNQAIYMAPGSPMFDDVSHRSYSITTNSSRQLPTQKSSGTLQSQSSASGLQRPRSPFPYPTRLKRPGVRPASPALAENGCIDYSRMIELDRFSQRTVHGSYKSTYNNWARRPPPLSLRSDFNRSTASLPSRASPGPYYPGSMPHRSRTPGSSQSGASRYGRFERHARLPIDRSGRSPSLTSIVDMYRRPSTAKGSRQPPQTAGSFYYDYSEDFDKPVASHHDVNEQISVDTATIQDDDDHNYGEFAVEAKPGSHGSHYAGVDESISQSCSGLQHGAADQEEPTPEPNLEEDTTKSIVVGDTELSNLIATRRLSRSAPAGSQPSNSASDGLLSDRQEATVNRAMLSKSDTSQSSRAVKDKPRPDCHFNAVDNRQQSSDIARCTLDPTLPDFASIFSSFDLLGKSPCFKSTDISARILSGNGDADSINSSSHNPDIPRYCRNVAAVRVSTAAMNDESEHLRDESMHEQELDILSPEPISPAHGLKVKNSIPQLMKALPPLPPGISTGEGQNQQRFRQSDGRVGERRQFDCSRLHDAIQRENEVYLSEPTPNEPRKSNSAKQNSPSKFKVRVKPSDSPLIGSGDIDLANAQGIQGGLHCATAPAKPKLKLKLSRSQFGQGRGAAGEALARVNRLKQCNSLADLALYSNIRTTAGQRPVNEDSSRGDVESEENVRSSLEARSAQSSAGDKSPQPSDPFSIPYPASPGDNTSNKRSLSSSNKDTLVQRTSCSSDRSPVQESGLRKKVSMFRLRIAESFTANSSKKSKKIEELERSDSRLSVKMTLGGSETNLGNMDNNHTPRSTSTIGSDWVTRRVKRWATDARRVLRSYVRRTLDRSSRWSE